MEDKIVVTPDQLRDAAAARILAKRDNLLAEQRQLKEEQLRLAARERELDRELAECRAAARFFDLNIEPGSEDPELAEMRARVDEYRARAIAMERRGESREAAMWAARSEQFVARLRVLEARHTPEPTQQPTLVLDQPTQPAALPSGAIFTVTEPKMPKIRDLVLDQVRNAGEKGRQAAPVKQFIETTYSTQIHSKTVGMTLYRLSQEGLVHRKGQTWFYGPQAKHTSPTSLENPGVGTPGLSQTVIN